MHAVTEILARRLALASHDVSEGGLVTALAEMVVGGWGTGRIGRRVEAVRGPGSWSPRRRSSARVAGFVLEVPAPTEAEVLKVCEASGRPGRRLGETTREHGLVVSRAGRGLLGLSGERMSEVYFGSLETRAR